jgi:hypothetical protein
LRVPCVVDHMLPLLRLEIKTKLRDVNALVDGFLLKRLDRACALPRLQHCSSAVWTHVSGINEKMRLKYSVFIQILNTEMPFSDRSSLLLYA